MTTRGTTAYPPDLLISHRSIQPVSQIHHETQQGPATTGCIICHRIKPTDGEEKGTAQKKKSKKTTHHSSSGTTASMHLFHATIHRPPTTVHCSARPESRSFVLFCCCALGWTGQDSLTGLETAQSAWSCMQKNGEQATTAQSNLQMASCQLSPAADNDNTVRANLTT